MTLPGFVPNDQLGDLVGASLRDLRRPGAALVHQMEVDGRAVDLEHLYEPRGRTQVVASLETNKILDRIAYPTIRAIDGWFPDGFVLTPWYLFSYQKGQFIIPHADGASCPDDPGRRQLAALSIWLTCPDEGGQFYTVRCPFTDDWTDQDGVPIRTGLDPLSSRYDYGTAPRWHLSNFPAGSAVLFGSEVVHGTEPVTRGSSLKALTFLTEEI